MAKRSKRLEKSIESIKAEIEKHFEKIDKDILERDEELAGYHLKEIDMSLIDALTKKVNALGKDLEHADLIKKYGERLERYRKKLKN